MVGTRAELQKSSMGSPWIDDDSNVIAFESLCRFFPEITVREMAYIALGYKLRRIEETIPQVSQAPDGPVDPRTPLN